MGHIGLVILLLIGTMTYVCLAFPKLAVYIYLIFSIFAMACLVMDTANQVVHLHTW